MYCLHAQVPTGFTAGKPIPLGHSHNDYTRARPLWEALENGFTSLEIDVYTAGDGTLRVSHLPLALAGKPTLETLYLKPLREWIDKNGGHVYPDTDVVLTLMIDLKGNGNVTYPILKKTLLPYRPYITIYNGRSVQKGPLRLMLSGNRPVDSLAAEKEQWFSLDGALGTDYDGKNVRVDRESAPFAAHFKKTKDGSFSAEERDRLLKFVEQTGNKNRELRFWAAGNNPKRWQALAQAGVTVINADKLELFRQWVMAYMANKK